jgi:hypothetical protein
VSRGAHGLQPEGHEHVRCRYCRRIDVHVQPGVEARSGGERVKYGPHTQHGTELPCQSSRGQYVHAHDRNMPDPEPPTRP